MPHAALDEPVLISAGELLGVDTGVRVWRTVGITFKSDGGHRDIRKTGKAPFQIDIPRLAFSEPQPQAVVVDHDANMIRIVARCRTASEGGIVEVPFRRSQHPAKIRSDEPTSALQSPMRN